MLKKAPVSILKPPVMPVIVSEFNGRKNNTYFKEPGKTKSIG